jgi:hypothetical protein
MVAARKSNENQSGKTAEPKKKTAGKAKTKRTQAHADAEQALLKNPNIALVKTAIDEAEEVPPWEDEDDEAENSGAIAGRIPLKYRKDGLPVDCPVHPIGVFGENYFFLDELSQLRILKAGHMSRLNIQSLFGSKLGLLTDYFPRMDKEGTISGWRPEKASERLMIAASRKGIWDPGEKIRGQGGWRGEEDELIFHLGDQIFVGRSPHPPSNPKEKQTPEKTIKPGVVGDFVYPAFPKLPPPFEGKAKPDGVLELLDLIKTWNWRRKEVDPLLLLGWLGAAMLGGALKWRPLIWVSGDKGTGKSTLHDGVLKPVFDGAIISVSDTTAAGIWQKVGHATLPIAIDELEAEADNRRTASVIKLARQAASGGVVLRGGADHAGAEFKARSCFLFSSILIPPLMGQDKSRIAVLDLGKISGLPPNINPKRMREIGQQIKRRLIDGWGRLHDTIEILRQALADVGFDSRGIDQFGTLIACADIMMQDNLMDTDSAREWAELLRDAAESEKEDNLADHDRCLEHLVTSLVDVYKGGQRRQLGEWIATGCGVVKIPGFAVEFEEVNAGLGSFGLRIIEKGGGKWLAVANSHQGLQTIFKDTQWASQPGTTGVWMQSLRRVDGAVAHNGLRFNGVAARATIIPVDKVLKNAENNFSIDEGEEGAQYHDL